MRLTIDSAARVFSIAVVLLGFSVMGGWHFGVLRLVQLDPALPPMQYNTALCFVLAGAAALLAVARPRIAGGLGLVVVAIGLVSFLQYPLERSFGIDELLMQGYVTAETSPPGRMAPQTAVAFVLAGSALALSTFGRMLRYAGSVSGALGSLVAGFGVAAFIGYGAGIEPAHGWMGATPAALHTAAAFAALAFALVRQSMVATTRHASAIAIPVGVAALATTLVLFEVLQVWQLERVDAATSRVVERATAALEQRLRAYLESFGALTQALAESSADARQSWEPSVAGFLRDQQVFLAVSHIGPVGKLDWIFPEAPYTGHLGFDYSANESRLAWLTEARARNNPLMTAPLRLKSGRSGVLLVAPLERGRVDGGQFAIAAALLEDILSPSAAAVPTHSVAVYEGEGLIYGSAAEVGARTIRGREVQIDGAAWRLAATPVAETVASLQSPLPWVVLGSGLLVSFLLAAMAHLLQTSSRQAAHLAAANSELQAAKHKLERLALFDELTGLGNRNLLMLDLDKALDLAQRDSVSLPLLLVDLNGFKSINDAFGHQAGDDVLREFAARLMEALPDNTEAFRTGGDEFAVLVKPGTGLDAAHSIARQIGGLLREPFLVGGEQRFVGASVGLAAYPQHGQESKELLRAADAAMYLAKHSATGIELASEKSPTAVLRALRE